MSIIIVIINLAAVVCLGTEIWLLLLLATVSLCTQLYVMSELSEMMIMLELHVLGCRVDMLGTNCDQCLSMVQCCFTSTETVRLIRTGRPGRPPRRSHNS